MNDTHLKIGFLLNPIAGIGGPVALKGSDGVQIQQQAAKKGGAPRGESRASRALVAAAGARDAVRWLTWGAPMGAQVLAGLGVSAEIMGEPRQPTTAADTGRAARAMADAGADLLLFCGGDGTARDLLDAVGAGLPAIFSRYTAVGAVA